MSDSVWDLLEMLVSERTSILVIDEESAEPRVLGDLDEASAIKVVKRMLTSRQRRASTPPKVLDGQTSIDDEVPEEVPEPVEAWDSQAVES